MVISSTLQGIGYMAMIGKSIRIHLIDGTVTGVKFGEVVNQTIQSISCPRLRMTELNEYWEAKRPGVYFLFGEDEETGEVKAYIGEAENVYERLQHHLVHKEFWNEVIFFVSKDENLTKSHVKYLESRLIQIAISTRRYKIDNSNQSQASSLPRADRDAMEEFLIYLKLLLGVLGHKLLEDVSVMLTEKKGKDTLSPSRKRDESQKQTKGLSLFLSVGSIQATAIQTDEGIVVMQNSEAAKDIKNSLQYAYREQREKLINNGMLKLTGNKYIFQNNILFTSASAAAGVIVGYSIAGPQSWKTRDGKTLREIEQEKIKKV